MAQAQEPATNLEAVDLDEYFKSVGMDPLRASPADVVVALLRINTPESLALASDITGKPIKVCPPAVPPWKPKPVSTAIRAEMRRDGGRKVMAISRNPCLPTTKAFQKFRTIRVGMTEGQLLARGLSRRDIRVWAKKGHLTLEEKR